MPIRGRSLGDASNTFLTHLNSVLHTTIVQMPLSLELVKNQFAHIRFRGPQGSSDTVPLETRYGAMHLYIGQVCTAERETDGQFTLQTNSYRYFITRIANEEPLFRWEYVRFPGDAKYYCRHHFQGPIGLGIIDRDKNEANLNDWHLPTGWVPIEDIIRFCIVDLGVKAFTDERAWDKTLTDSYRTFRADFSSPGQ